METCIEILGKDIKCRDSLIRLLYSLLSDEPMFQSIYIYGHVSCGKSFIVQKLLKYLKYNISIINCLEHTTSKSMFEKIIIDLSQEELNSSNGYKLSRKCDNFVEFISEIQMIAKERKEQPIVILIEKCEKLRNMDANLLPALLQLGELTKCNICTILSSDILCEKYNSKVLLYEPIKIHFPQFSQEEVKEILMHTTKPDNYSKEFYDGYLKLFLPIFFRFCRDLNELRYMAKKNFTKYIEPVESNLIDKNNSGALWRNIINTFRANVEVIYLRVSADDFEQQVKLHEIESTTKLALSFELPVFAKYLLVAGFIASYNPVAEDKRLFMKESTSRRKKSIRKKKKILTLKEGPKSFPLSRLLAIFCSIIDMKVDMNAILLTQVPSMCQLGLFLLVGDNNIDEPKYKCCISFEFAMVISKTIGFELKHYLHDFLD